MRNVEKPLSMEKKIEILSKLYLSAFESFKKSISKKDKNYEEIRTSYSKLKDVSKNFSSFSQIRHYSLLLAQPYEQQCPLKIIEKIITTLDTIIKMNLIDQEILQEMIIKLLSHLHRLLNFSDENVSTKLLDLCLLIYSCEYLSIHGDSLKYIIKICLGIYLSSKNQNSQEKVKKVLSQIIKKIITNMNLHIQNSKCDISFLALSTEHDYYSIISKIYIEYILDVIEICDFVKNQKQKDILNLYISTIKEHKSEHLINEIEKLNLENTNIENNNKKIGKYGWCIFCRNSANKFNTNINFPICDNNECENEINKIFSVLNNSPIYYSISYRKDYITIVKYLSKISTSESKESNDADLVHSKCHEFCLNTINEMIEYAPPYLSNDTELIYIIKDLIMDSLVKNTLSNEIIILKLSLKVFLIIFKKFRQHLKEQIALFINSVLLAILDSENLGFDYKNVVLETLLNLSNNSEYLVEIYVNYDCSINFNAVFYDLINLATKIMNGYYKKSKFSGLFRNIQEKTLRLKCFEFLTRFIDKLSVLVQKNIATEQSANNNNNIEEQEININEEETNPSNAEQQSFTTMSSGPINASTYIEGIADKISHTLKIKNYLNKAIEKFNISNQKGCLKFLISQGFINNEETFNTVKQSFIEATSDEGIGLNTYIKNLESSNQSNDTNIYTKTTLTSEDYTNLNIFSFPFYCPEINPLIYYLQSLEHDKLNDITYDDYTAFEMNRFIKTNISDLKRNPLGDYLCSGKAFNIKIINNFINSFDFKDTDILKALRIMFLELPLCGEGQVVDRVMQIFGQKYYQENPTKVSNADLSYYIAFSIIMLNTDLHREEVDRKMSKDEYVKRFFELCPNEKIDTKKLENIYDEILVNPLVIPGQKLNTTKNKQDLIKMEKENILSTIHDKFKEKHINSTITGSNKSQYIIIINNKDIKNLVECSWSNFLGIFSQLLADFDDEKLVSTCIQSIMKVSGICVILDLNTQAEAFINTILNMTNVFEGKEISSKNLECILALVDFMVYYGQYIKTCWYNLLIFASKIEFYSSVASQQDLISEIKYIRRPKNLEKEIEIEIKNAALIQQYQLDLKIDKLYLQSGNFPLNIISSLLDGLCRVSINEMTIYKKPRDYSLRCIVQIAQFNIKRIQIEWVGIWKIISMHFKNVITQTKDEGVWNNSLDMFKQTIFKLLPKKDLSGFNFQKDFFSPLTEIFINTTKLERCEIILNYAYYIVCSYVKVIHSGWISIFALIKEALKRKDKNINDIQNLLKLFSDNFSVSEEIPTEVFTGYIECLCHMYIYSNMKEYAFNSIISLLNVLFEMDTNMNISMLKSSINSNAPSTVNNKNKKYQFMKIFFYGFDDLMANNSIEHLNLLLEIINYNKENLVCNENTFLYIYFSYFKPHLVALILSHFFNGKNLFDINTKNNINKIDSSQNESQRDQIFNLTQNYLNDSINSLIQDLSKDISDNNNSILIIHKDQNNMENRNQLIQFLKVIEKDYHKNNELIVKKLNILSTFDSTKYENTIYTFLEKFCDIILSIKSDDMKINYQYYFEDILISLQSLFIHNIYPNKLLNMFCELLAKMGENPSNYFWLKIFNKNEYYLNMLSEPKKDLKKEEENEYLLRYENGYINFEYILFEKFYNKIKDYDIENIYKILCKILSKFIELFMNNNIENALLLTSEKCEFLLKIQEIKKIILNNLSNKNNLANNNDFKFLLNCSNVLTKLEFDKESIIYSVIQIELDEILPHYYEYMENIQRQNLFEICANLIECDNKLVRISIKKVIKTFIDKKYINFTYNS